MKLTVADAYGSGYLDNSEHGQRELNADDWTEVDVRDTVHAGETGAMVRYREDGREIEVGPNDTYQIEYVNEDVIDVRGVHDVAAELIASMDGIGTDEDRLFRALDQIPTDHSHDAFVEQLRYSFNDQAGRALDDALEDDLSGDELERAKSYLR